MKANVKQDKLSGYWLAVMVNTHFGYTTTYKFATKQEAQTFVDEENAYRAEIMSKIPKLSDYFNIDNANSSRNRLAK